MSAERTKRTLAWLKQLAGDPQLSGLACRAGTLLALQYMNAAGEAWPAQGTLGEALSASRKGVQKAIRQLAERGHLEVDVHRGRSAGDRPASNRYRAIVRNANYSSPSDDECEQQDAFKCEHSDALEAPKCEPEFAGGAYSSTQGGRTGVRTNLLKEPSERTIEGDISFDRQISDIPGEELDPRDSILSSGKKDSKRFEEFYAAFPRHVGRDAAQKAFERVLRDRRVAPDELIAAAKRYAAERVEQDPKYTKHPATWLNAGCWNDEPASAPLTFPGAFIRPFGRPETNLERQTRIVAERRYGRS